MVLHHLQRMSLRATIRSICLPCRLSSQSPVDAIPRLARDDGSKGIPECNARNTIYCKWAWGSPRIYDLSNEYNTVEEMTRPLPTMNMVPGMMP